MKKFTLGLNALILSFAVSAQTTYKMQPNVTAKDYLANTIIIKVKDGLRPMCNEQGVNIPSLQNNLASIGMTSITKKFKNEQPPREKYNKQGLKMADLSLIYECKFSGAVSIEKAINVLLGSKALVYAEPHFVPVTTYTPNDPQATPSGQYHLNRINAYNGWNTSKGDTTIIIGITDTGTELTHSDLQGNIKYNYADPINSIDDDGDGFIDNYNGWDVGMNDNDPTWQGSNHGVHVSGIAAAATDNANGVAGVGFKCKFLPVKIADATGVLIAPYDGIKYAADHGCKVINCSWGGPGGGQFGQDICTYATVNKDALVVAAAGNTGLDELFYPAAYDNVMAVVNTQATDVINTSSTYGYFADVAAPGTNINSTVPPNSYSNAFTGTSMSSPIVAGVIAIVRSYFPSFTGLQACERVKTTTDNIYSLPLNNQNIRKDKLGTGRVNLGRALTDPLSPSVVYNQLMFDDKNDDIFNFNDTLRIGGLFTNYLAPTTACTATLATSNAGLTILSNTISIGALGMMGTLSNTATPFSFKIVSTFTPNTPVNFTLTINDGTYTARSFFTVIANIDYINITVNDVLTTATSKGKDFYSNDAQSNGLGFLYKGANLIYDGGLMIGTHDTLVSDCIRSMTASNDADFRIVTNISEMKVGAKSNFDTYAKYNDSNSVAVIGLDIDQRTWAWNSTPDKKYVIWEYIIRNNSVNTYTALYAGICADWDIAASSTANTFSLNMSAFDAVNKMGYSWCTNPGGLYGGIKLLTSSAPPNFYGIDNVTGGGGGVDIYSGFSTLNKYKTLSTSRLSAGNTTSTGNDVLNVMSAGPYNIGPGQSIIVAFALIAGDSLLDLQASAAAAQVKYNTVASAVGVKEINSDNNSVKVYPNPATDKINVVVKNKTENELMVYDMNGKLIYQNTISASTIISTEKWSRGIYFVKVSNSESVSTTKIVLH
jgi:serine protease